MSNHKIEHHAPNSERLGEWLRALRRSRDLPLRVVAAAAEMDTALLSKIELGQRLPTETQTTAFAAFFCIPNEEIAAKRIAEKFWMEHGKSKGAARAAALINSTVSNHHKNMASNG